jgi:hypothetical protein
MIPVNIQSSEHLADLGLVDEISKQGRDGEFYLTRGILESHNQNTFETIDLIIL